MMTKKPYTPPQIFQVELNQQQAILAACSTSASTLSTKGRSGCTGGGNCKRSSTTAGGAAATTS